MRYTVQEMTTEELIKALKKADPQGKTKVILHASQYGRPVGEYLEIYRNVAKVYSDTKGESRIVIEGR